MTKVVVVPKLGSVTKLTPRSSVNSVAHRSVDRSRAKSVFVSYARLDKYVVAQLVTLVALAGFEPWFDHKLVVGRPWHEQLREQIERCQYFLYALSNESIQSEWCQWEFSLAIQFGKPIIPVLLRKADLPAVISRYQYADFTEGPTPEGTARLVGGLIDAQHEIPVNDAPKVSSIPDGQPVQAD